jgi:iron complex outermembrane receptor protein
MRGARQGPAGALVTVGIEGGADWVRSSNLGDHSLGRLSAFTEWRHQLAARVQADAALRVDRYDEFGTSWSPSAGIGWWPSELVRLRTSAGRAFRVPTFTERYYSDPANLARPDIGPESAWAGEVGADLFVRRGWLVQTTVFARAEEDVIDWLRPSESDRWRTYNIRTVDTHGIEVAVRRSFVGGAFVLGQYTWLDVDAAAVDQLSKYVLDFAPHSITAAASIPLPGRLRVAPRVELRRRVRATGSSEYTLVDAQISRSLGRMLELSVVGANLLDAEYQEIAGVAMPGAAVSIALSIRP